MLKNSFQLNTENKLTENFNAAINNFWEENAQADHFRGVNNKKIYTVSIKTGNKNAIVISQGRNESTLKYKELVFELNHQGYDLYLIDHRGQGLSERLGGDQYHGHVEHFNDYIDDFQQYVLSLDLQHNYQNSYLLSHSMGGTISALYLQQFPHPFQAGVLISPMLSINVGIFPEPVIKLITSISDQLYRLFSRKPCYIFGGKKYKKELFANNKLTSSKLRFDSAVASFEEQPATQLGSPTLHWVAESMRATKLAINNADKINIPILVIQAEADSIVTSAGQNQFFRNLNFCEGNQFLTISGAKHEILLEKDQYRQPALNTVLQFLKQAKQGT